jgi:hypothetical protein
MEKLNTQQLTELAGHHNWHEAAYDNNGVLCRSLTGGENATDWHPVTDDQLIQYLLTDDQKKAIAEAEAKGWSVSLDVNENAFKKGTFDIKWPDGHICTEMKDNSNFPCAECGAIIGIIPGDQRIGLR